jgi:hypothetical protein
MATETLGLPDPASVDVYDGGQDYDLAVGWQCAVAGSVLGVEWFAPTNAPGVTTVAKLWRVSDNALLASKVFTPVLGVRQQILFDTPVPITVGTGYRVSVYTDRFTLTFEYPGWPITSGNLSTANPDGWLAVGAGFPDNGPRTALYHVSPVVQTGEAPPAEGSAAVGLNLAVAGAGARSSAGAGAVALNLAVAGAGARASAGVGTVGVNLAVAGAGARPAAGAAALGLDLAVAGAGSAQLQGGSAALGLDLAVAAAGGRPAESSADTGLDLAISSTGGSSRAGSAALGLNLAIAAAGARPGASGSAALVLNLAVAASGSNGQAGRPVAPYPFTPAAVTSFPCTPRPVKSFTEVVA